MNRTTCIEHAKRLALGLAAIALAATPSFAQTTYDLCASDGTVTIGGAVIPIWGYADITGGGSCTTGLATLPGPELAAVDGSTLTINLSNALSVPVSIFIPGMAKTAADALAPERTTDLQGRERLVSLDQTVGPSSSASFSWTATEGTYLYHSGADIRTQVPMGLYGALVVSGATYPTVAQEEVLVFSEIDPALNANPGGFGGARVMSWDPQYFLINGTTYDVANPPIAINTSADVLLRFVNAGLETFVPTLGGGLFMDVIAEDGNLYPYPLTQYGIELTAGKTIDAVVNVGTDGTYAIYDRSLHLTRGGLVATLQASAAAGAPTTVADSYSMDEDGTLSTVAGDLTFPGVLDNDTGGAAAAVLVGGPVQGSLVGGLSSDGSFTYQPAPDFFGVDHFTYVANDGVGGPSSSVATVTITVNGLDDAPAAVIDGYEVVAGQLLSVAAPGVLGNDSDPDGDALTVGSFTSPSAGILDVFGDGGFDFNAAGLSAGTLVTFEYDACDPTMLCSGLTTVTITVAADTATNVAPTANDDTATAFGDRPLVDFNIVANDVDPDGTIDPTSVVIITGTASQHGGTVVNNGDGTVTYTKPVRGFKFGTDTFQYTVNDNDGATSNVATVRVNVTK